MTASDLSKLLGTYRFNYTREAELHNGIRVALEKEKIEFLAEVRLTKHDRIDFMVGTTGVEVKVGHPLASVMRQVHRYMQCEGVSELLIVTNRCRHSIVPGIINDKKVEVLFLGWGMLG